MAAMMDGPLSAEQCHVHIRCSKNLVLDANQSLCIGIGIGIGIGNRQIDLDIPVGPPTFTSEEVI
jgi:hypothetical protein